MNVSYNININLLKRRKGFKKKKKKEYMLICCQDFNSALKKGFYVYLRHNFDILLLLHNDNVDSLIVFCKSFFFFLTKLYFLTYLLQYY